MPCCPRASRPLGVYLISTVTFDSILCNVKKSFYIILLLSDVAEGTPWFFCCFALVIRVIDKKAYDRNESSSLKKK